MTTKTVQLRLQLTGQQAAQELKRISDQQVTANTKLAAQWTQIGSAQAKFVNTAKIGTRETLNTARAGDQLLQTNRMLEGVLRQQSIQTKLQSQLLKQQVSSAQQVANWSRQVEQSSKRTQQHVQQTSSLWQKGTALTGGVTAAGMFASNALKQPRDYAQLMTYITTTATGGQGLSTEQRLGKRALFESFVKDAVRQGGGKREDAAAALNELIASGKYDETNVAPALLASSKTAFAAGADTIDAAKMTLAMQNFGVKDLSLAQDRAMRAGQVGSFEYKDLAKFLPSQMAMANAFGYSGDAGLIKLLSLNQIAKMTAADSSEAGNNVVNLLQKLSSRELGDNLADKIENTEGLPTKIKKNKKGKVVGREFDWATYSIQQREQGVYGVEAFINLLEHQLKGNKQYTDLQNKAKSAKTPEELKSTLSDMSNIAMGSQLGQFIADRQALLAAMAAFYNKDKGKELESEISNAKGTVNADIDVIKQEEWAKDMAMNQEKLFAQSKMYDSVSDSLGNAKDKITEWAQGNEDLAASAYGATIALGALALGAGAVTLLGGKGGLGAGGVKTPPPVIGRDPITNLPKTAKLPSTTVKPSVSTSGALGLAGAAQFLSSQIKPIDDYFYGLVDKFFGGSGEKQDFVEQAIDQYKEQQTLLQQQVTEQQQQNQLSRDVIGKLNTLINVTEQNKPVNLNGSLLDAVNGLAQKESNRHGSVPASPLPGLGG